MAVLELYSWKGKCWTCMKAYFISIRGYPEYNNDGFTCTYLGQKEVYYFYSEMIYISKLTIDVYVESEWGTSYNMMFYTNRNL